MNYAVVDASSLIVNVVVFNGIDAWNPPEGCTCVELPADSGAGIGWSYVDGEFVSPPKPAVESDQ
jgi:hypothetical protein